MEAGITKSKKIENLTAKITALEEHEQQTLWEHVAELNFRNGLYALSEQYREKLQRRGELDRSAEEILAELRQTREKIAAHDYPGFALSKVKHNLSVERARKRGK